MTARYLGYLAACPIERAVMLTCAACNVRWLGCADVFECPECGEGEPPWLPSPPPPALSPADREVGR